jgi:predicted glycoside hydrolase/deacetylase ChbG (UPF0249 family)
MTTTPQIRTLVIHHDDLGGSHSANIAFVELFDLGVVTSGSVMVPCPRFPEIAALARQRPDLDLGVHLTLTAEFPGFRWRPLTAGEAERADRQEWVFLEERRGGAWG